MSDACKSASRLRLRYVPPLMCLAFMLGLPFGITAQQGWAVAVNDRVENFRLLDHTGASHELYYYGDAKAIVFMVQGNGCPIVRNAMPAFKALRDQFERQGVQFFLLNSNLQDNRTSIRREAETYQYDLPILMDSTQIIGEALKLTRTGEVFAIDPKTWTVTYSGAVDDRLTYENQKAQASHHYLHDAIASMVAARPVEVASTEGIGCLINFPARQRWQRPSTHKSPTAKTLHPSSWTIVCRAIVRADLVHGP